MGTVEIIGPVLEGYIPHWAWPLELLHRLVFGSTQIGPIEDDCEFVEGVGLPRLLTRWWLRARPV